MIVGYEDRPFHMYEENDKYRHNEFDSCIDWKDNTPCEVLKSYIDWNNPCCL